MFRVVVTRAALGVAVPQGHGPGMSAVEVAERVVISRHRQRCLSALARSEVVRLELRYGATGRPEHCYRLE